MGNNNNINKDNDTRKIITMIVMICTLMLGTTGATYAYFAISDTDNTATGTAATAGLTVTVEQAALKEGTNTGVMVPQLETALNDAMNSTNKCVDGNGNIICKVYTITVTNTSTAAVKVNGTIQFSLTGTNAEMKNLKWRRTTDATTLGTSTTGSYAGIAVDTIDTIAGTTTIDDLSTIYDLTSGSECNIAGSATTGCTQVSLTKADASATTDSATYYIVIWINETTNEQTDGGTWRATITFQGANGSGITSTITG